MVILLLFHLAFARDPSTILQGEARHQKLVNKALQTANDPTNCKNNKIGYSKLGPTRDQNYTGWCYAYGAADLATFYSGHKISATDIAIRYSSNAKIAKKIEKDLNDYFPSTCNNFESTADIQGGFPGEAFNLANQEGFCDENRVESQNSPHFILDEMRQVERSYTSQTGCPTRSLLSIVKGQSDARMIFETTARNSFLKGEPSEKDQLLAKWVQSYKEPSKEKFWKSVLDASCMKRSKLTMKAIDSYYDPRNSYESLAPIQQKINAGEPAVLALDIKPFLKETFAERIQYLSKTIKDKAALKKAVCEEYMSLFGAYHALTVIGQQYNSVTQKCELILRNSWGGDCKSFNEKLRCERGSGNLYAPIDDLLPQIRELTTVEKKLKHFRIILLAIQIRDPATINIVKTKGP